MGYAKRRTRLLYGHLRGDATGPEQRHFAVTDCHRIAEFGLVDVAYADRGGVTEVDRRSVYCREACTDLDGANRIGGFHRAHAHYHVAGEAPGARAIDIGTVHRHVNAFADVAHFEPVG